VKNELRWNPFLRKWIIIAPAREHRPLDVKSITEEEKPGVNSKKSENTGDTKKKFCPFCVGAPEVPETFDVKVLPNKFPALSIKNFETFSRLNPDSIYKIAPAIGHQEVILYTPKHDEKFRNLTVEHIVKLVKLWKNRYEEIGSMPDIKYVFEFENRGRLIGVSLIHPHGQIYSFSWIPLYIRIELDSFKSYLNENGHCLLCDIINEEINAKKRIIKENSNFLSCVPFFASWPHEVHIYAKKHVQSFSDFNDQMIVDFARILKDINYRYDYLYPGHEMSFVMAIHQQPTDGQDHNYYHFHVEFYPPIRGPGMQKFAAGVELGTGAWINSSLPENFAKKMRDLKIPDDDLNDI